MFTAGRARNRGLAAIVPRGVRTAGQTVSWWDPPAGTRSGAARSPASNQILKCRMVRWFTPVAVERLKTTLNRHPGSAEVHLGLINGESRVLLRLGPMRVAPTSALLHEIQALGISARADVETGSGPLGNTV
jgi:hypothetical protein